jgi:hypothetical protein
MTSQEVWAVAEARLHNEESPAGLESGVVYERHYTFNWLIGYFDLHTHQAKEKVPDQE